MATFEDGENSSPSQFYRKRLIADIQLDDEFVQIIGFARNLDENDEFYLEDGEAKIHVREIPEYVPQIYSDTLYRIFGHISIDGGGTQYVSAELIQHLPDLNFDLYHRAMTLSQKIS